MSVERGAMSGWSPVNFPLRKLFGFRNFQSQPTRLVDADTMIRLGASGVLSIVLRKSPIFTEIGFLEGLRYRKGKSMSYVTFVLFLALAPAVWRVPAVPATAAPAQGTALTERALERINKEVRHELLMLPYYGVFDALSYKVAPDGTVVLLGAATRPSLKSDAENAVKHIEGVEKVVNQIEVLPPSPMDDQTRRAEFRTIYGSPQLTKYSWQAVQSIHIIVKNGNVTLDGVVDNSADKQVAEIQAKSVPGVFSVTNNLQVAESK
jgi:hyperosmotically inducible periplasmic protein